MFFHVHTKAMSTLPQFLSAISHFHAKAHLPSPTLSCAVSRALEGAKRSFGKPSVSRKIISLHHLRLFGAHAFSDHVNFVRLRTIWRIFMQFYGLLRFSEASNLVISDISWTNLGFDIFIAKSKTDQTRKGDWVSVASQPDSPYCPVAFTRRYISLTL